MTAFVTDRDDRYPRNRMQTLGYVVVVDIVGLVKDHDEWIFHGVMEMLRNVVDGRVSRDLIAGIGWMLSESLAKNRTGALAEATDVGVRD